jgi:hypothetical protein
MLKVLAHHLVARWQSKPFQHNTFSVGLYLCWTGPHPDPIQTEDRLQSTASYTGLYFDFIPSQCCGPGFR